MTPSIWTLKFATMESVSIAGALLVMGQTESTRDTLFGFGHGLVLSLGKCLDQSIQPPPKNGGRCLPDLQVTGSVVAVTIHWTGLLDWTTGLTFDLKCSIYMKKFVLFM